MSDKDFADFEEEIIPQHTDFEPEPLPEPSKKTNLPLDISDVDLLRPPGFVGNVTDWIDSQCRYPRRRLAVASAIVTIGNIGGMRHEDAKDGVTANMLAFCVAASATGKEAVQQAMADLHVAARVHRALAGGIKSEQEIMRNILEHQAAFYLIDEIGIMLTKVRNAQKRGGAAYLEGVFGLLMSAYSKANSRLLLQGDTSREITKEYGARYSKAMDEGDDEKAERAKKMLAMAENGLERPFLSLIGYTTPNTFDNIVDGETATQGFVGRAIIVSEKDINPSPRQNFKKPKLPFQMSMRLAALYGGLQCEDEFSARVEAQDGITYVETDEDACDALNKVSLWLIDYADEVNEQTGEASVAMVRRSYEMIAKISFILAIPDGVRTVEHVVWAFAYVLQEVRAKIALVFANDNAKTDPEGAAAARVLSYIDPEKGCSLSVLSNRSKIGKEKMTALLTKMEKAGMVYQKASNRKYRGKNVTVWHLTEEAG